jgi:ABC-2 type transport system permease protein
MISDVISIIWKEMRELVFHRGRFRGGWTGMLFFAAVFGIFMPLQTGPDWIKSPIGLVYWAWVPFLLVSGVVADSFAGERERHTLETLLSSRLSDRAILLGKMATSILYGWGLTMICALIGLITINIAFGKGQLLLYPPLIGMGIVGLSFLIASLSSSIGVLVSLHASTVRQAQQTFSLAFFAFFIPIFLIPLLPEAWKLKLTMLLSGLNYEAILFIIAIILLGLNIAITSIAMARFQRAKLIFV